jgi:hypothetical protein
MGARAAWMASRTPAGRATMKNMLTKSPMAKATMRNAAMNLAKSPSVRNAAMNLAKSPSVKNAAMNFAKSPSMNNAAPSMKKYAMDTMLAQLPGLIETAEPQIEAALRRSLQDIRTNRPQSAQIFLTNWKKINKAVQEELPSAAQPPSFFGNGVKRTRKTAKRRKHRKDVV